MATREQIIAKLREAGAAAQNGNAQAAEVARRLQKALADREYEEVSNDALSFAQGVGQGTTLGFSDEIMSGVAAATEVGWDTLFPSDIDNRSVFDRFLQSASGFGDKYETALESTRGDIATARQEDPWLTFGGEVAGGMLTGGSGGARAVAGKSLREGASALAKTAGKYGAAAGYGYSEGDPLSAWAAGDREKALEEAKTAAGDAAFGGGVGLMSGFAFPYIAAAGRKVGQMISSPFTANARLNELGRKELLAAYEADIAGGYITPDDAIRELKEVPGMVVGDLGPNLRNEFMRLAQLNTEGGAGIRHFVTERNRGQFDRLYPKLSKILTGKEDNNFARLAANLAKNKKEQANILYDQVKGNKAVITGAMRNILKNPQAKTALNRMNKIRQMEGKPPFDPANFDKPVTVDELDSILRGFDAQTTQLYKANPDIATAFKKNLRDPLRKEILESSPELKMAKEFWAGESMNEEALELGRKVFTDDYRMTEMLMDGMSESEKMFHKMGVMEAFAKRLESKSYDADLIKSVANSPQKERVLSTVFGSRQDFNDFMAYLAQEDKMFQTMKEAMSNSNTTRKILQQQPAVGERFATQFGYNVALGPNTGPLSIGPRLGAWIAETAFDLVNPQEAALRRGTNVANRQAQMLLSKDLKALSEPHTLMGLLDSGVPRSTAVAVPGLLSTGGLHNEYGGP